MKGFRLVGGSKQRAQVPKGLLVPLVHHGAQYILVVCSGARSSTMYFCTLVMVHIMYVQQTQTHRLASWPDPNWKNRLKVVPTPRLRAQIFLKSFLLGPDTLNFNTCQIWKA